MAVWEQFVSITEQLDEIVQQKVTDQNREAMITQIDELLDGREQILPVLTKPQTSREQDIVNQVLQREPTINQRLEHILNELKVDLRNMKKQRSSKQRYTNPYQSVSGYDGMFMDHKK
ncbi:flagellar protein FliT [Halobacillus naozhouensis]|uniref:Flagellar protein FliT n=1 Tax=Halobacillus naozhouensis TaxID=554880 RepID=A0ABY8IUI6_9BACI|nr:flagellar protein FliT [Halobacillus naozhouensis]WFT73770.1 flagellar protein FliT [Halobacillus naozhouensis]